MFIQVLVIAMYGQVGGTWWCMQVVCVSVGRGEGEDRSFIWFLTAGHYEGKLSIFGAMVSI